MAIQDGLIFFSQFPCVLLIGQKRTLYPNAVTFIWNNAIDNAQKQSDLQSIDNDYNGMSCNFLVKGLIHLAADTSKTSHDFTFQSQMSIYQDHWRHFVN